MKNKSYISPVKLGGLVSPTVTGNRIYSIWNGRKQRLGFDRDERPMVTWERGMPDEEATEKAEMGEEGGRKGTFGEQMGEGNLPIDLLHSKPSLVYCVTVHMAFQNELPNQTSPVQTELKKPSLNWDAKQAVRKTSILRFETLEILENKYKDRN